MTLVLSTDTAVDVKAASTLQALLTYENYTPTGYLTNEYPDVSGIEVLGPDGTGQIAAETGSPIIGSKSGSYDETENTLHTSEESITGDRVYVSLWVDSFTYTSSQKNFLSFASTNGNTPTLLMGTRDSKFWVFNDDTGNNFKPPQAPSLPALFEVWMPNDGSMYYRINGGPVIEETGGGSVPAEPHHLTIGGNRVGSTTTEHTAVIDQVLLEVADQEQLALPEKGSFLWNGGNGRTQTEIENELL